MTPEDIDTLVLDLDGTLVDIPIDYDDLRARLCGLFEDEGITVERPFRPLFDRIEDYTGRLRAAGHESPDDIRARAYQLITDAELKAVDGLRPRHGVDALLRVVRRLGLRIAIVTRNSSRSVERVIEVLAQEHGLQLPEDLVVVGREDTETSKPDPAPVLLALKRLGSEPGRAVVVGDTYHDIMSGNRSGALTIKVGDKEFPKDLRDSRPSIELSNLEEVARRLETDLTSHSK